MKEVEGIFSIAGLASWSFHSTVLGLFSQVNGRSQLDWIERNIDGKTCEMP